MKSLHGRYLSESSARSAVDGRIDLANLLGERSVYPGAGHTRTSNV